MTNVIPKFKYAPPMGGHFDNPVFVFESLSRVSILGGFYPTEQVPRALAEHLQKVLQSKHFRGKWDQSTIMYMLEDIHGELSRLIGCEYLTSWGDQYGDTQWEFSIKTCSKGPEKAGYLPCTRYDGHTGPCAHPASQTPVIPKKTCPACGSDDLYTEDDVRSYTPPYGKGVATHIWIDCCNSCKERGEFSNQNDNGVMHMIREADAATVIPMLNYLNSIMISDQYIERALRLPAMTINGWRQCGVNYASNLALLRIIRTFPGILSVADGDFLEESQLSSVMHKLRDRNALLERVALAADEFIKNNRTMVDYGLPEEKEIRAALKALAESKDDK